MERPEATKTDWSVAGDELADELRVLRRAPLRLRRVRFTDPWWSAGRVGVDGETIVMTLDEAVDRPGRWSANEPPDGMVSGTVRRAGVDTPTRYAFVAKAAAAGSRGHR
jgi:hypothetical protein